MEITEYTINDNNEKMKKNFLQYDEGDFYKVENNYVKCQTVNSLLIYGKRKNKPKISFMIPTYKRNDYIIETIKSVLEQTELNVNYEIVIVDNEKGNNELANKLKAFSANDISYYQNDDNIGMFNNWNRCIELANGEWILILHDDDTLEKSYLQTIIKIIDKNPEIGGIACNCNYINEYSEIKHTVGKKYLLSKFERKYINIKHSDFYWFHPIDIFGLIINREKAIQIGGFNEKWFPVADYQFMINLCERYGIILTTKKIFNYRIADNESKKVETTLKFIYFNNYIRQEVNRYKKCTINKIDKWYRKNATINDERIDNYFWTKDYNDEERDKYITGINSINEILGYKMKSKTIEMKIQKIIEIFFWRLIRLIRII